MSLQHDDAASRHTSVSKRPASTASRAQTLIKRNIAVNDLRPSDILIERFQAWKQIVKMLISYFEGVADIENNTARELTKLGAVIQVPFKAGNQFLGEGGMQDVFYNIRDKTRTNADHHANFAKTVDGSIVQHLQKLRLEIKAHIKNVQNDTGKLAANVAKERDMSTKNITDLARAISVLKNSPMGVMAREDPYAQNVIVFRQLQKQVNEENALQKSIIMMQHNSANFEEGIVRSIQSAWQTFDEWQTRMISEVQDTWRVLAATMGGLQPTKEWVAFAGRSDHLLDPDTPLRNPDTIDYPGKDDPSVVPVHVGLLERKKRFTRSYSESYFVLTPAGYLHEYGSSDPRTHVHPMFSLFLPACTLGPPSSPRTSKSHKFHIESKKDKTPGAGKFSLGSKEIAYTFRARSHDEMMEWWNDIRMLVARYLVASESVERTGPVAAAVRAVGYVSEDEEEGVGSSMDEEDEEEEEEEEEDDEAQYQPAQDGTEGNITYGHETEEAAPAYTAPVRDMALEMGPNGYPLDKKHDVPGGFPAGPAPDHQSQGAPAPDDGPIAESTDIQRRLSRRQEKAPEGQAPRRRPVGMGEDLMPPQAPATIAAPRASSEKRSPSGSAVGQEEKAAPASGGVGGAASAAYSALTSVFSGGGGAQAAEPESAPAEQAGPPAAPTATATSTYPSYLAPVAKPATTTALAPTATAPAAAPAPAPAPAPAATSEAAVSAPAAQPAPVLEPVTLTDDGPATVTETTTTTTSVVQDAGPAPADEDAASPPGSPTSGSGGTPERKVSRKERRKSRDADGEKHGHGLLSRFKEALK